MKHLRLMIAMALAVVALGIVGAGSATADVRPASVEALLQPGESAHVEKEVDIPEIPAILDIFLLEDETGSFGDDIAVLKTLAPAIWDAIALTGTDFTMGVGGYRDFAQSPFGSSGDHVYRRTTDLTSTKATFVAGVNALGAGGGADGPEAQLEALHYVVTPGHAAIDSNGDGDTTDAIDTAAGLQPTWRAGSTRVVLLTTDAGCHVTGGGGWPGDAGTTSAAVTAGLASAAGVTVIGLVPGGAGTNSCIDTLAAGTGGSVHATTSSGAAIKDAILAGLASIPTTVTPVAIGCNPLLVTFSPGSVTLTGPDVALFAEWIFVPANTPDGVYHCTVEFRGTGDVQEIWITVERLDCLEEVTWDPVPGSFVTDPTPVAFGPAGTFTFDALMTNTGGSHLTSMASPVSVLSPDNRILNYPESPATVGDVLTLPLVGDYADGVLSPGETATFTFVVGLDPTAPFSFFVDLRCVPTAAVPDCDGFDGITAFVDEPLFCLSIEEA